MKTRKVNDRRNSHCGSTLLINLDWKNWWIDTSHGLFYLHVKFLYDDSWHRVYCRFQGAIRLKMMNRELKWIIDDTLTRPEE